MGSFLLSIFYNVLVPCVALGFVVFIHELGHFMVAKWCGIKVERFSIGFGPRIASWKKGNTQYQISWLFFGGYVKFLGDELEVSDGSHKDRSAYYSANPFLRILVCFAGPLMNLLLGFLIYCLIFFVGRPTPIDEKTTKIGYVVPNSPAEYAGVQIGDEIRFVDGRQVSEWKQLLSSIALSSQDQIHFGIDRDGMMIELDITPKMDATKGLRQIGIGKRDNLIVESIEPGSPEERGGLRDGDRILAVNDKKIYQWGALFQELEYAAKNDFKLSIDRNEEPQELTMGSLWDPILQRIQLNFSQKIEFVREHPNPWDAFVGDIVNIYETLKALISRTVSPKGLAGPVGIIAIMGIFAKAGFVYFLGLIALISINLGVFNLLPIPVLDGGHVMFNLIELVRRRSISKKAMVMIQNVFVSILIGFILYVTFQDVLRLGSKFLGN